MELPAPEVCNHAQPEICVNLWCFLDDQSKLIYLLAGRVYALKGSAKEKLDMLRKLALNDYCVARTFFVPKKFSVHQEGDDTLEGCIAPEMVKLVHAQLFEHVFQTLEKELPMHVHVVDGEPEPQLLCIPKEPLCVTTCVVEYEDGRREAKKTNYDE